MDAEGCDPCYGKRKKQAKLELCFGQVEDRSDTYAGAGGFLCSFGLSPTQISHNIF